MEGYDDFSFCRSYITGDERIVWKGRPEKGNLITSKDLIMVPFGLVFCGFSLFWEFSALQTAGGIMGIFGIPFVLVGLYLAFGRFIHNAYMKKKTYYVITNKRLIIKKGKRTQIFSPRDLPPMEVEVHKNGNGTITFYEHVRMRGNRSYTNFFSLDNIRDYVGAQNAISSMEE